ncbi:glycerophosphodiester phosphodiesterase [Roseateles sp. MS654]|uniref:glycerophosphodiester phosphodiesterase n=1 Tax=Roseateles sp. MS654 TaxID=3412685 RepID=UPI003C2F8F1D
MLGLLLAVGLGVAATGPGRSWLHRVDSEWLGERVMDSLTRVRSKEDWSLAEPLRPGQDYRWLKAGGAPVRIAHALGEAGTPSANTLGAMRRAYQAGLRIFEVDLVLEDGELHCQHDPGPQTAMVRDGCTFETLLAGLPPDAFVVLDIKTDFEAVGRRIVDRVKGTAQAPQVVFQLYRPEDVARFNGWRREADLPGPILTAYLAHRRIDHVAAQVSRIGLGALTLPLERLPALSRRPDGAAVLVHPVHNCGSWSDALRGADGVYTLSALRCAPASTTGSS